MGPEVDIVCGVHFKKIIRDFQIQNPQVNMYLDWEGKKSLQSPGVLETQVPLLWDF